jgi:hypothetical protein
MKVYQVRPDGAEALVVDTDSVGKTLTACDPMQILYTGIHRFSEPADVTAMVQTLVCQAGGDLAATDQRAMVIIIKI